MKQPEARKLFEAERLLRDIVEVKSVSRSRLVSRNIREAMKLISEAISYEDDEPRHVMTDDL